jgi:hypothetical protein
LASLHAPIGRLAFPGIAIRANFVFASDPLLTLHGRNFFLTI